MSSRHERELEAMHKLRDVVLEFFSLKPWKYFFHVATSPYFKIPKMSENFENPQRNFKKKLFQKKRKNPKFQQNPLLKQFVIK